MDGVSADEEDGGLPRRLHPVVADGAVAEELVLDALVVPLRLDAHADVAGGAVEGVDVQAEAVATDLAVGTVVSMKERVAVVDMNWLMDASLHQKWQMAQ